MRVDATKNVACGVIGEGRWEAVLREVADRLRRRVTVPTGVQDLGDVLQEAALTVVERAAQFRGHTEEEVVAWMLAISVRKVRDYHRFQIRQRRDVRRNMPLNGRFEPVANRVPAVSARLERLERCARLAALLDRLPADEQQAVLARHVHGLSVSEIAARLRRSEAAVGGLLKRGLARLRAMAKQQL